MFPIQKTLPKKNNKYYNTKSVGGYSECIVGKPTQSGLNVLDNCVGWACGRFNEVYSYFTNYKGMKYPTLNCDAEYFIKRGKTVGLKSQKDPIAGGIMVWEGKGSKAGHVAFVERVNSSTQVYTSESGYKHFAFANKTRNKGNGNWGADSNYKYLGCLINPAYKGEVALWQEKMNEQWHCGLAIDGSYGPKSKAEANKHYLHYGIKAPIMVKWLQTRLNELGYSLAVDSSFGPLTRNAVKNFQKKKHLAVDGNVGENTVGALLE